MRLVNRMIKFAFMTAFLCLACGCGGLKDGQAPRQDGGDGAKAVSSEGASEVRDAAGAEGGAAENARASAEPAVESSARGDDAARRREAASDSKAGKTEPLQLSENGTLPDENGDGGRGVDNMTLTARGDAPWNLKAERISYDDAAKRARASSIIWNLLDKEGKSVLEVRGDAAVINVATQGVAFEGPVKASGGRGESIVCNKLIWDSSAKKLRGSKGVRVVREGTVMTGRELTASPDLKQVEVSGNVRISFVPGKYGGK